MSTPYDRELEELVGQLVATSKQPIQAVARQLEELVIELDRIAVAAHARQAAARELEDVLQAAFTEAYALGAKMMLERVAGAIFNGLAGASVTP